MTIDVTDQRLLNLEAFVVMVAKWAGNDNLLAAAATIEGNRQARIRNVPEHPTPTQYAPELVERMVALVKRMASWSPDHLPRPLDVMPVQDEARSIVSDLPQEVDSEPTVEVQEARALAAALCSTLKLDGLAQGYRDGKYDGDADELREIILTLGMPR